MEPIEFLNSVFADFFRQYGGYIEIRCIDANSRVVSRDYYTNINSVPVDKLIESSLSDKKNVYIGVAPRSKKSGKATAIKYVTCIWSDLDTDESEKKLQDFPIEPSIIVYSGHGRHAYWLLKEPAKATKGFQNILKGVHKILGSDHVHDFSRVMRLPGTWNVKNGNRPVQSKVIKLDNIRYGLDVFNKYKIDDQQSNKENRKSFKSVPVDLDKFELSKKCLLIIKNGNDGSFESRSEADYFVISSLIEAGATDDEIYSLYNIREYKIFEKYHEKGRQGDDYLRHTIYNARAKHKEKSEHINDAHLIADINIIRLMDKRPSFEKKQKISALIINHLKKKGQFFRTHTAKYFFDNKKKKLLDIESEDFDALLIRCSSLNPTESEFKYVKADIKALIVLDSPRVEVHRFSFYDKKKLHIYNNAQQIYRIDGNTIDLVDNGTDEVLFLDDPYADPIIVIQKSTNLIEDLVLNQINFSNGSGISLNPVEQRLLMKTFIYSVFFKSELQSRPIVAMIGPKGSGKSHICRAIGKILIGQKFNVNSVTTEEAYYTIITNNTLAAFDNVDGKVNWLNDALAVTATGGFVEKRKLYTTNENVKLNLDALIMINSRTPKFKRDDVADRLIIFKLDRIENFRSGEKLLRDLEDSRNHIWHEMLQNLNGIVKILQNDQRSLTTSFRMAEWAEIGWKIAKFFGDDEIFLRILRKLSVNQSHFTLEDDLLFEALQKWIPQNRGREVTASELYDGLSGVIGTRIWESNYRSAIALGRRLNNVITNLSDFFEVQVRKGHKGKSYYCFDRKDG